MKSFIPELFLSMKGYTKNKLAKDIIAGIIVAIIALPLSIALALASGVAPEQGIYTAIVAGFVISFLGGSKVQIAGPTAAFASIVAGVVARNGMDGLIIATIIAGIILVLMGVFKLGNMIKFIPYTITTGFTAGIAVTILIGQIKDFCGITFVNAPIETIDKVKEVVSCFGSINLQAVLIGIISLAILIVWPMFFKKIPASLIAVVVTAALVGLLKMNVNTIGDLYTISDSLPTITIPSFSYDTVVAVLPDAFTIAILAAIESLLSCVVADEMINSKHNSNMELVAQGVGNTFSALFGGIPATGAIARTAANIKNGGRTPIAGIVHAVVLLLVLVLLMPYAALIPMPCIAAILFVVAYNMCGWRSFLKVIKRSPKSDIAVMVVTFVLTVVFDLVVAIGVGLLLTSILFMKRMSDVAAVTEWKYDDSSARLKHVPEHVMVFEFNGPMFFGATDKLKPIKTDDKHRVLILRMHGVHAMDYTALKSLGHLVHECRDKGMEVIFAHVNEQPMAVMRKAKYIDKIGEQYFCKNIDEALELSERL